MILNVNRIFDQKNARTRLNQISSGLVRIWKDKVSICLESILIHSQPFDWCLSILLFCMKRCKWPSYCLHIFDYVNTPIVDSCGIVYILTAEANMKLRKYCPIREPSRRNWFFNLRIEQFPWGEKILRNGLIQSYFFELHVIITFSIKGDTTHTPRQQSIV